MQSTYEDAPATAIEMAQARRNPIAFWSLLWFIIRDYLRSAWVLLNLLVIAGTQALFFNYKSDQSHLFSVEYIVTALLAAATAAIVFARANRAESYPILARRLFRASYAGALMLAAWLIAVLSYVLSILVEALRFSNLLAPGSEAMPWRNPGVYLAASLPVLLIAAFAVCLVGLLSTFIAPGIVRLVTLAVLALLVMSFDSRNFPIEGLRPLLQNLPPALAPLAGAIKYAASPLPDSVAVTSVAVLAVYTALLAILDLLLFSQRELILN